jgi:DnaJ-class molecular chaperone
MGDKDPYDILGVSRSANQDEIKRAYRRLAKQHHPDRNPGNPKAADQFKEVQAAYEVLGDPQRRQEYDQFGAGGPRPDFHGWDPRTAHRHRSEGASFDFGSFGDLSSIFEQFFTRRSGPGGGRAQQRTAQAGPPGGDLEHRVHVTFEESLSGTSREVVLNAPEGGTERIAFRIPAGVEDGQRIRVRGKGHLGAGGRGDLIITCHVTPHAYFRRSGKDLHLDAPLTIAEAALGGKIAVPTLSGSATVTIPPGTSSGTKLRLRGHGVPGNNNASAGDLIVVIKIQAPPSLSERARELLISLQEELGDNPRDRLDWQLGSDGSR